MDLPLLALVHESEAACRDRLLAAGHNPERAMEIASYLAQSTDIRSEIADIETACHGRGIAFAAIDLDEAPRRLAEYVGRPTLVWTMTDGIAYFRGSLGPSLARLNGLAAFGAEESLFALCQNKFRSGAVMAAAGLPVPSAGLARDGMWLVEPPVPTGGGYFVKPNRLGAKIGIWPDSRCPDLDAALAISRRIWQAYRDDALVQAYVPGRNVRASFLAVEPDAGMERLGVEFVDAGGDFQTMADSLALYGETGQAARDDGTYVEPSLVPVALTQPQADRRIRGIAERLGSVLGLRDVFSIDLRVEADDTVHLIEFEVCPGLPCFDFREYCRKTWAATLAEAMATAAAASLAPRQ